MRRRIQHLRYYLREQLNRTHEANRAALLLLGFGLGIIAAGFVILYRLDPREGESFSLRQLVSDLYANGGAELLSIALTVLIIERLNRRRAIQERKEELILQLGSPDNGFAVEAARILRQKGWLTDGNLKRANLSYANLQRADLDRANLQEVSLMLANLQEARLWDVNLQQANLWNANLQEANLIGANLQGAKSWLANLHSANLGRANLQGARLEGANLEWARLEGSNLQETDLTKANLQKAGLVEAKMQKADLWQANLQRADLARVNLQAANLGGASLQGANLIGASLQRVIFKDYYDQYELPICDKNTILPDGSRWTPGRDWREFTHPEEWAAEQATKKRFTFSKPPGFARGEVSASGSKPNAAQKPETAEAVGDEPL